MIKTSQLQQRSYRWLLAALISAGGLVALVALLLISPWSETKAVETETGPAEVQPIEGTELSRVVLTEQAAERLGIETTAISDSEVQSAGGETTLRKVVPYSAILYDVDGGAFVYTSPEPLTFVRAPITVDYIKGDVAVLSDGPSSGTAVVTVGSAELFGAEFEFEE
ncbi:MAG: hypothetical protein E6I09_02745 [Chloroflexi bacterium]|jgi:hypothetical protein|nr:MAG: hypothetical protein E6I09_02745 [Chloroflexota bacterium]